MSSRGVRWTVAVGDLLPEGRALATDLADEPGSSALFLRLRLGTLPKHAVSLPDGSVVLAFLNVCTHMGCRLIREEHDQLLAYRPPGPEDSPADSATAVIGPCSCHGTTFDAARGGLVVLGPATQDLQRLDLELDREANTLVATLPDTDDIPLHETWPDS